MIEIGSNVTRNIDKFWNNCLFHPTDAVEDPWGKKILDKMATEAWNGELPVVVGDGEYILPADVIG